ncbi:MAG: hypothetical protein COA45_01870 [Zetaproteobacteria bacterium]|nr:MAG: hypothetical protein COA45_01870 [Zetaproteobacteria bacterium]
MDDLSKKASLEELFKNITIGLAVSFVAISLGASLGILSGRGAFAGMISAGVIAFITAMFGGTRVQCSGPTAPMSTITAVVIAFAVSEYEAQLSSDQFITLVFLLMSGFLILAGFLRLGRFINLIPNVVVSGFMSGIALLIWNSQANVLFGFSGVTALSGALFWNVVITVMTVTLIFVCPLVLKKLSPKLAVYLPGTLLAIIISSAFAYIMQLPVQFTSLKSDVNTLGDLGHVISAQVPHGLTLSDLMLAVPFAMQLTLLCYLDTLLTSLVVDNMSNEKTRQNKELMAQGAANGLAAMLGGIPGAQATIRSVLMLKENATMRLAGICVGLFVFVEIFLFKDFFAFIPSAVFCGILFKVGYDVFDWQPLKLYARQMMGKVPKDKSLPGFVSLPEILFISGTMLVTLFYDLNAAVIGFTILFYVVGKFSKTATEQVMALDYPQESEGVSTHP